MVTGPVPWFPFRRRRTIARPPAGRSRCL